jgi:hypothetical protein
MSGRLISTLHHLDLPVTAGAETAKVIPLQRPLWLFDYRNDVVRLVTQRWVFAMRLEGIAARRELRLVLAPELLPRGGPADAGSLSKGGVALAFRGIVGAA